MKKIIGTLVILLVLGLFGFFLVAAKITDARLNVLILSEESEPSQEVAEIHDQLLIADWHADNMLWDRDLLVESINGHVDLPRLQEGNVALQVFDAVIKTPKGLNYHENSGDTDQITMLAMANRWPIRTWSSLYERAIFQSKKLHSASKRSDGQLVIVKSRAELQSFLENRKYDQQKVAGILAIEGLHALEGNVANLDGLVNAGYRIMGLTHFFDNEVGGSSAGVEKGGLTDLGKEIIERMNNKSIIIDLAHASSQLIADVLELTTRPVVVTHTGVQGIHNSPRNLSDEQLIAIANNDGMVGIGFWEGAVGSIAPRDIARSIKYVVDLIGIEHVSLGSDWDGATTVALDAAHIWILTEELMKQGFSQEEIAMVMGRNQIDFLLTHLPAN